MVRHLISFSGLVFCSFLYLNAQENSFKIDFPDEFKSANGGNSEWVITNFGERLSYKDSPVVINFPEDFNYKDTGLLKLYFTGYHDTTAFPRNTFVLIGNYKDPRPVVYTDTNHNIDFSDDGPGQKLSKKDTTLRFMVRNDDDPRATFTYQISPLNFQKEETRERVTKQFQGREHMAKVKYWKEIMRLDCKITKTVINGDTVKIGIKDYNCNGYFNDSLKNYHDRVMVADPESGKLSSRLSKGAYI